MADHPSPDRDDAPDNRAAAHVDHAVAPSQASAADRSPLRGVARLAVDATLGVTGIVEAMHARIARPPGTGSSAEGRTRGISGLVYRSIRGVTRISGVGLDAALARLEPALARRPPGRRREALVAALNGVLGDHLAASANPLAVEMTLRHDGTSLPLEREALARALPRATSRLLVLVHGLCMHDGQWLRHGHDHGAMLAREQGWTAVYLRYNSGLHIAANGRAFALAMQGLVDAWPRPIDRLAIIGHSMGGLVARSALLQAAAMGPALDWPRRLGDLVFLGTPHHGAPLERAGQLLHRLLGAAPYAAPLAQLGRVRSAGITDLRHGRLLDDGAPGADRFDHAAGDTRAPLPLPAGVRCHALAACLGDDDATLKSRLLGDGLVPLDSALGRHADPARTLAFDPERQHIVHGCGHFDLLDRPQAAATLASWLARADAG